MRYLVEPNLTFLGFYEAEEPSPQTGLLEAEVWLQHEHEESEWPEDPEGPEWSEGPERPEKALSNLRDPKGQRGLC